MLLLVETSSLSIFIHKAFRGEGIIVYECTSHPSNIKTWILVGLLPIHLTWPWVEYFGIFKANSDVKSTQKIDSQLHSISKLLCWMNERYARMRYFPLSKPSPIYQDPIDYWRGAPYKNPLIMTIQNSPRQWVIHNIIQIHNNVMWDWQCSTKYSPHSNWIWRIFYKILSVP